MKSNLIGDTGFQVGFVLEKLRESGKVIGRCDLSNLLKVDVQENNEPAFMSRIVRVVFTWREECSIRGVVLKVPGFRNPGKVEHTEHIDDYLMAAHTRECKFYELFSVATIRLKIPEYYYGHAFNPAHNDGLILMEDLTDKARTVSMLPGFSEAQLENVVREIAKVHALSWHTSTWLETLGQSVDGIVDFITDCWNIAQELRTFDAKAFSTLLDRMKPFYTKKYLDKVLYTTEKYGIPPCCVHNDLWAANVLWTVDGKGQTTDNLAAIIDWQTVHAGNPGEDLARLLAMNVSADFRRRNTDRLLQLYLEVVTELLGKRLFGFDDLKEAYNQSMASVAVAMSYGVTIYYKMDNVTGGPNGAKLKAELLDRSRAFFEDTLAANQL